LAKYVLACARANSLTEGRVRAGAWASISIDVARNEPGEHEIEWLPAISLTESFGIPGPDALPCLPLRGHIAQKIHGITLPPRPGKRNERFRDLIDLLLMEALVVEYTKGTDGNLR
jgi:hypothetical protein